MVVTAFVSFLSSCLFVKIVLSFAKSRAWFDSHDHRKIHDGEIPRLGGVGFTAAYMLSVAGLFATGALAPFGARVVPLIVSMLLILVFGVYDDFRPLRARWKLLAQMVAAAIVLAAGFKFRSVVFHPIGVNIQFGLWSYPLTFIWIVGVTNAVNLIDGVDGLAGGVSALAALTFAAIFAARGNGGAVLLCVALAGVLGGFLVFNAPFPRAKVFMGDGGSQFLGYILSVLPLLDNGRGGASLPLPFAAALLIIPIFDTFAAIWRRTRDGRSIQSPDRAHTHHKLMNLGLDARKVDAVLYALQVVVGVLVYFSMSSFTPGALPVAFLATAYLIAIAFFSALHFLNRGAVRRRGGTRAEAGTEAIS